MGLALSDPNFPMLLSAFYGRPLERLIAALFLKPSSVFQVCVEARQEALENQTAM